MKVFAQNAIWADEVEIRMGKDVGRHFHRAEPIVFKEYTQGEFSPPCMILQREEAQLLIDALYSVGLRPSQAAGSAGQLTAVQYHLEDMRKLVGV